MHKVAYAFQRCSAVNAKAAAAAPGCTLHMQLLFPCPVTVQSNTSTAAPLLHRCVPAGTGVAPMMGFLQERAALAKQGAKLGPAHLFFGCRSSKEDFIYREELEGYLAAGVLTGLHVAFSREGPTKVRPALSK